MPSRVCLALVLLAACADAPPPLPDDAQPVPVQSLPAEDSSFDKVERLVIRDDAAWATAWSRIVSHVPERPAIDFTQDVVILAAMGSQPTTGFDVAVDEVRTSGGNDWFMIRDASPGDSCIVGNVITRPVAVVTVPRFSGRATFVDVGTTTVECQ